MGKQNVSLISRQSQSGFIEVLLMMGIVTIAIMSLMSVVFQKRSLQVNTETKLSIDVLQQNYSYFIQDNTAWKYTLNDPSNASFACLMNGSPCNKQPQPINVLRNPNNEIAINTMSTMGIKYDGTVCSGYTAVAPGNSDHATEANAVCSLHVDLTWQPICKGACKNPSLIQVNIAINKSVATSASSAARFIASIVNVTRRPSIMPNATHVGSGDRHTCAIADGEVYCWGNNNNGQLGQNPGAVPSSVKPLKVPGLSGATDLSVGMDHNCVIQASQVKCWGNNWLGKIGLSGNGIYFTPTAVPDHYSGLPLTGVTKVSVGWVNGCAVSAGAAYCWGGNVNGELGIDRGPTLKYDGYADGDGRGAFMVQGLNSGVTDISAGESRTCAIVNGGIKCWGNNDNRGGYANVCGSGTWTLGYNAFNATLTDMSPRGHKVCWPFYLEGTTLFPPSADIWNTPDESLDPSPFANNGFYRGNTALNTSWDPPRCTDYSPLEVRDRTIVCNPVPQTPAATTAWNSPDHPNLAAGSGVLQIVMGGMSNCVVIADKTLRCWGNNNGKLGVDVPLGSGNYSNANNTPQKLTNAGFTTDMLGGFTQGYCAINSGKLYCWGGWNTNYNPIGIPGGGQIYTPTLAVGMPTNVTYFRGGFGNDHNCLVANNRVYCWGKNADGELGDGTTTDQVNGVPVMVINWP